MDKKVQETAKRIIEALELLVSKNKDWNPKVYIGKADDEGQRENEHLKDDVPLVYLTVLAEGESGKINELEKQTIEMLNESASLKAHNKRGGGGGNPHAKKLYVAFTELFPNDQFGEYDLKPAFQDFPISL